MSPLRAAVIAEARTWLGTPFHHKQGLKGVGVDCLHLWWRSGEAAGAMEKISKRELRGFWPHYGRRPDPVRMRAALETFRMVEISEHEALPGDVLWTHWGNEIPVHFAIVSAFEFRPTIIHAVLNYEVVEHTLAAEWPGRIDSFWRYPLIAAEEACA